MGQWENETAMEELIEGLIEWAIADKAAADSLYMHSNNPSDRVLELCEAVVKLTEENERLQAMRQVRQFKDLEDIAVTQSQALKEAEEKFWSIKSASHSWVIARETVDCKHTYEDIRTLCDSWLAKYGEKK